MEEEKNNNELIFAESLTTTLNSGRSSNSSLLNISDILSNSERCDTSELVCSSDDEHEPGVFLKL